MGRFKTGLPNQGRDRDVVMDRNDRSLVFHSGRLKRLPVFAENHPLKIDLPAFFAELPVTLGGQVHAFGRGILVFRAGADHVRRIIHADFPLCQCGGRVVGAGVLLGYDHLDCLFLSRDGRQVGVVIPPQLAQFLLILRVAGVGFAVRDEDRANAVALARRLMALVSINAAS